MDVGQGDGAVLISPQGEILLFDNGHTQCAQRSVKYLTSLGLTHIDYMMISHYHKDHFGCTKAILDRCPLRKASYDRPGDPESATDTYDAYVEAVGNKRKHVNDKTVITLDADSNDAVTINIAALNGAGVQVLMDISSQDLIGVQEFASTLTRSDTSIHEFTLHQILRRRKSRG